MKNSHINYILSEDAKYDIKNLRPVIPGDEYYLIDNDSGAMTKVGEPELKEIFTHSVEDLNAVLTGIVKKNIHIDLTNYISGVFNRNVKDYFENFYKDLNILNFKGETTNLPDNAVVGSIYEVQGKFYVYYTPTAYKQVLTVADAEELLSGYYTKDESEGLIEGISEKIDTISSTLDSEIQEIINAENSFIRRDEYLDCLSGYERKIAGYKSDYRNQLLGLSCMFEEQALSANAFRQACQSLVDRYTEEYDKLKQKVDGYQNSINGYKEDIDGKISVLSSQISGFQTYINNTNAAVSLMQNTLNGYSNLVEEMKNTIQVISGKLENLLAEDQRII